MTDVLSDVFKDAINGIGNFIHRSNRELLTVLRQPTPITISAFFTADATGTIGGGLTNPNPVTIWTCPLSHEAWLNRIAITSPTGQPKTPITTGQALCTGSTANELIFFLPVGGVVAPTLITEGRLSAAQLNNGEKILFSADSLPANTQIRIDLQIVLTTGVSPDTPLPARQQPITNINIVD